MAGKTFRCASFFAGVGGIDIGFEGYGQNKNDKFEVVYANEIDPYAVRTYELNFGTKVDTRDIREVAEDTDSIPDFDVMLAGFPCQAFSIAGYRHGFNDERGRGTLFFELIKIIRAKHPSVVFLENVKNLVGHNGGDTFATILDALSQEGYKTPFYRVMNAMEYGDIPQNRERIYIVAFADEATQATFVPPEKVTLTTPLSNVIDFNTTVDEKYYYRKGKYTYHYYKDADYKDVYTTLMSKMDDPNAVYQWRRWYVRKNKAGVVPTLTANMGGGGHNVPVILTASGEIRKLLPRECFNVQGFPKEYRLPEDIVDSRLYKQAGNSVCVSVIHRIADSVYDALVSYNND